MTEEEPEANRLSRYAAGDSPRVNSLANGVKVTLTTLKAAISQIPEDNKGAARHHGALVVFWNLRDDCFSCPSRASLSPRR